MTFQPNSWTSGMCVWPQQITRASVREMRSRIDDGSRSWSKPCVCEPGEAWADEDEVVADPDAALGGQAAEPAELLVVERRRAPTPRRRGSRPGTPSW